MLKSTFVISGIFLVVLPCSVRAQMMNPGLQAMNIEISGQMQRASAGISIGAGSANKNEVPQSDSRQAYLSFTRVKSQTPITLKALAKNLAASNPANGQQAEQLFASNDVIGAVQGVMNQYGLQKNNVAHAYALYWVVYWGLANNVHDAPSERALQAVAAQAERGFANNAEFAQLDNAAKQAAAEELMALTAIFDATSEQAKSDPTLAAQIAKASLEGSRKSGLELDKMTLTEDGFVPGKPRKGADASGAVGDDTKQASAAGDDKTLQYSLMAALGLGAAFMIGKGMKRG
jgi:hypothetical protein